MGKKGRPPPRLPLLLRQPLPLPRPPLGLPRARRPLLQALPPPPLQPEAAKRSKPACLAAPGRARQSGGAVAVLKGLACHAALGRARQSGPALCRQSSQCRLHGGLSQFPPPPGLPVATAPSPGHCPTAPRPPTPHPASSHPP